MKPSACARSRKHLRQIFKRYVLITPRRFPQMRHARSGLPFASSLGCFGTKSTGIRKVDQNRYFKIESKTIIIKNFHVMFSKKQVNSS